MDTATSFLNVDVLGARKLSTADGVLVVANRNRSEQNFGRGIMMVQQSLVRVVLGTGDCCLDSNRIVRRRSRRRLFRLWRERSKATTARRRRRRKQPGLHFNPDSYNYALHDETLHEMFSRER
jgi:hypothetical protein